MDHVSDLDLPGGGHTSIIGVDGGGAGDPVVVLLPALGVAAGYYGPFAAALAAEGVAVLSADFPGQGVSRPLASRRNDFGYAAVSDDVVAATVAVAQERYAGRPLAFIGHSFGGQVAMVHLATHASAVRALVLIGSGSPYWRGFPKRLKLLAQTQTLGAVAFVRGHWPGDRLGFGGRQPRQLMREWARFARRGELGIERGKAVAEPDFSRVNLPVLAITLDNDSLAPQGSVDNLADKLTNAQVEHRFVTRPAGEGGPAFDHFVWARHPGAFATEIAAWVRQAIRVH
ncbi:alpha/beta fold hydrolase [Knoellia sp. S7-12]|uniref:alpha/beta hydrolase family protein n=1 Tax=Knoellia sp. S7-12 TaxID=3126698 RepID=UPI0033670B66